MDRYDAALAETRQFVAEQNRQMDARAMNAAAEARRLARERWAVYVAAVGGTIGGIAGIISLLKTAGLL